MKKKTLVIGGIAVAALLGGGWALAQSARPRAGFGPPFMHGKGPRGMGPGMMQHMGRGGMMGMGPGMMGMNHDSATMAQMGVIHELIINHDQVKRTVTNLPDGIRTVTESDDPRIAQLINTHVVSIVNGSVQEAILVCRSRARRCTRSFETRTKSAALMRRRPRA